MAFLSISQAANYLGLSQMTLRRWEKAGKIKPVRTKGGQRRYTRYMLDCALAGKTVPVVSNPHAIGYCHIVAQQKKSLLAKQKKAVTDYLEYSKLPYEIIAKQAPYEDFKHNGMHELVQKICTNECIELVVAVDACISPNQLEYDLFMEMCEAHGISVVFIDKYKHIR